MKKILELIGPLFLFDVKSVTEGGPSQHTHKGNGLDTSGGSQRCKKFYTYPQSIA